MSSPTFDDFSEAMRITDGKEAERWMLRKIGETRRALRGADEQDARIIIQLNLGYIAGYHGIEAQKKMLELFGAVHPLLLQIPEEDRKGRQFIAEYSQDEIKALAKKVNADNWHVFDRARGGRA